MKNLVIKYPQIVTETKHIVVTDEAFESINNLSLDEQADFIYNEIDEYDHQWIPGGKQGLISALDMGYSSIKEIKK